MFRLERNTINETTGKKSARKVDGIIKIETHGDDLLFVTIDGRATIRSQKRFEETQARIYTMTTVVD